MNPAVPLRPKFATIALMLALIGCDKSLTVIDGSNPDTFAETTEQARRDLSIKDRLTFDTAIRSAGGRRYANNDPEAVARQTFHGMTAADVVADAHARGIE
jgi:hypothetical protein